MNLATVTVLGGGPAGSASAIRLARAGCAVTLFEKKQFPRQKLCGGFISPEALPELSNLGVLEEVRRNASWPMTRVVVTSPAGGQAEVGLSSPGLSIGRDTLDAVLLNEARRCGVTVREESVADPAAQADWTIVATGRTAKEPGGPYYGFQALFEAMPELTDQVEIALMPGAYVGLARRDADTVNVCGLATAYTMQRFGPNLDNLLKALASRNPLLARRLRSANRHSTWLAVGPVRMGFRRLSESNRLYVGDAACVVDPFVGEGIAMALHGARLLGEAFEQHRDPVGAAYEAAWRKAYQGNLAIGSLLRGALGHRFLQNTLVSGLKSFPGALHWLMDRTRTPNSSPLVGEVVARRLATGGGSPLSGCAGSPRQGGRNS